MSSLTQDTILTEGSSLHGIGTSNPTNSTDGFEKSGSQTGFFIYSESPYSLWLKGTSGWTLHQTFTSVTLVSGTNYAWGDYTAAYVQTSVSGHVVHIKPRTGAILVDGDIADGINQHDTLILPSNPAPMSVVTPTSMVPSSGVFSWSGQNTGLALQAGQFSWSGEAIYDAITSITFHKTDANGTDQTVFLEQYLNAKSGQIRVNLDDHPGHRNVYQIVGASLDANGHYKFDVYNVSMDEPAVSSGTCTVYFVLVGEQGVQGAAGLSSSYTTSFDGPHSLGDDRDPGESLGAVTVDTGLSYQGGEYVIVSMDARPDSFDIAQVTSYDSSTGEMHFNNIYQSTNDSDSTVWNINLSGIPGIQGPVGPQGPAGANGTSGDMGGTMTSHIIPDTNAAYDLGNAEYKIRHLFLSDNSMYIGDTWIKAEGDSVKMENLLVGDLNLNNTGRQNEVDGTSGHWSIQEGAQDLFLINRTTGKKYRFNITEVEEN